jgi:hypothetical protein
LLALLKNVDRLTCRYQIPKHQVGWKSLNRKTGELEREQEPVFKKIKLMFLFSPLVEWIDTTHAMRMYVHNKTLKKGKPPLIHRYFLREVADT